MTFYVNNGVQYNEGVRELAKVNIDSSGPRLPWAGKKVHIENVEEELSFLWRMTADNVRTSRNINVRTSVLNLMICAADIETAQKASQFMRELLSTHIARFTLLILNEHSNAPPGVSTWVTLRSFPIISDIMRHNFEQVTLLVSSSAVHSAAHIVQPLLKPDLPIYLWWLNDPPYGSTVFADLARLSSRIIVDSNTFLQPEAGINFLSSFMQQAPDRHAALAEHGRTAEGDVSPDPIQALLMAGWLKTILNWQLANDSTSNVHDPTTGTFSWHVMRPTGALTLHSIGISSGQTGRLSSHEDGIISIRPRVQADMRPGTICLVRLISDLEQKYAIFSLNRGDDAEHVFTSVELPEGTRSQRTVQVATANDAVQLLHDELEIIGRDHLFEETLYEVAELLTQE